MYQAKQRGLARVKLTSDRTAGIGAELPVAQAPRSGKCCSDADLRASSPGIRKSRHPSSVMSICSDWKLQPLSHRQVMNLI
jgi:hypothetical protein